LEELVGFDKPETKKPTIKAGSKQDLLKEIADGLGDKLNTKVKIVLGRKKGQLVIDFGTVADLNRILDEIGYKKEN
jgi:ParB family chromosome partitioning protein